MTRSLRLALAILLVALAAPALAADDVTLAREAGDAAGLVETPRVEPSYYPGYGPADPEYHYRKGLELSTELVSAEWVINRLTIFAKEKRKMVVSNDLLALLKQQMPDLKAGKAFQVPLQAGLTWAVQVEFTANAKLFFRNEVKMGTHKVWFELHRAKKSLLPWPWPEWELCGKTYEMHRWPVTPECGTEFRVLPE